MGSRSKFHKSKAATSPGRKLLHGPRPKKPIVVRFDDALADLVNENSKARAVKGNRNRRRRGQRALDLPTLAKPHGERPAPAASAAPRPTRSEKRALLRSTTKKFFGLANASTSRAERRRTALAEAREALEPKKAVRA